MRLHIIILLAIFSFASTLSAQNARVLTGIVRGERNSPLQGASIFVENKENRNLKGASTNNQGQYQIEVPGGDGLTIVIACIGYKSTRVPYSGQPTINMTLVPDDQSIEEVTVTTAGPKTRNDMGISYRNQVSATERFDMKELEAMTVTSLEGGLQGRMANVDIITSADPGARSSIRIRGTTSLNANSEPLIVVDGVPYPTTISDDFNFSTANDEDLGALINISPNDIETVEVLKDAAATAVWGSRGANGVLLFTTKKGRQGKTQFAVSSKVNLRREAETIPMLDGGQYVSMVQDALWNTVNDIGYQGATSYLNMLYNTNEIKYDPNWNFFKEYNQNTDWLGLVSQMGHVEDNSLAISGGGDKATYRVSLGHLNEVGTTKGTQSGRYSALVSVNYKFSSKFNINADMNYSMAARNSNWTMSGLSAPRAMAMRKMPNMSPYIIDEYGYYSDQYFSPRLNFQGSFVENDMYNPVAMVNESVNKTTEEQSRVNFRASYDIDPSLRYIGTVGFLTRSSKNRKFLPQSVTGVIWTDPYFNRGSDLISDALTLTTENKLIYNKTFNSIHNIIATQIFQTNESRGFSYASETSGNASAALSDPTAGSSVVAMGSGNSLSRSAGTISSLYYGLSNKYIFNAIYRWEANTNISRQHRWKGFPAFGLAWHLGDEEFMKDLSFLDMAKLRVSWGQSGNPPTGSFAYLGVFQPLTPGYMDMTAIRPTRIQLDNLKWETVTQTDIGVEFSFFKDRLHVTGEIYNRLTTDLLQKDFDLPSSTGFTEMRFYNSGKMVNKGWELIFRGDLVRAKDFRLSANLNFSRNQNEILELPENRQEENYNFNNGNYAHKIITGNPLGSFYGYKYLGVYQNEQETFARDLNNNMIYDLNGEAIYMHNGNRKVYAGDAKYQDMDGNGVINQYDIVYLGNAMPLFTTGGGIDVRYKAFTLTTFLHGRFGQKVVNQVRIDTENMHGNANQSTAVLSRWRHEGDQTNIPRALYGQGYNYLGSDRFVEDASFVRFKQLSLRYALPQSFIKRFNITRFDIFGTIQDLYTWTNYSGQDPEVSLSSDIYMLSKDGANTPRPRTFAFGILANF